MRSIIWLYTEAFYATSSRSTVLKWRKQQSKNNFRLLRMSAGSVKNKTFHVFIRTFLRDRAEDSFSGPFFQTVGIAWEWIVRLDPSTWRPLSKQFSVKCSEQTTKIPRGAKFARCVRTNRSHWSRTAPLAGLRCKEIPALWFDILLQPCTVQRLDGIF